MRLFKTATHGGILSLWGALGLFAFYFGFHLAREKADVEAQTRHLALSYVRLVEEQASATFSRTALLLGEASGRISTADLDSGKEMPDRRRAQIEHDLLGMQAKSPGIVSMVVCDRDGDVVANTVGARPGGSIADSEYFQRLKASTNDAPVVSGLIRERLSGKMGVQVARRLVGPDGGFAGAIVANLGMSEYFTPFYTQLMTSPGMLISLWDNQRRILVRHPFLEDRIGKVIPLSEVEDQLASRAREGTYQRPSPLDGIRRIMAFRRLADYPIHASVGFPEEEYLQPWREARNRAGAALAFLMLVATAMTVVLLRQARLSEDLQASREKARVEVLRRKDAEVLDAANATLRAVLDNSPISIAVVGPDRRYMFGNKFFCEAYGLTPAELVGRSPRMIFCSDEDFETQSAAAHPIIAAGGTYDCEQKLARRDGGTFSARVIGRRVNPANPALGTVWVVNDLTDSKQAEANRVKSEFLAMMSHEMRTPLNGIIGLISAVSGQPEAAAMAETHAMILDSANVLLAIIGDILDFALLERGEFHITENEFDLLSLIGSVEAPLRDKALAKGIKLAISVADDLPRRLRGDGVRLGQILANLLGNAVKFTDRGGVELAVTTAPAADGRITLIAVVEDTGIGIPAEAFTRLFQPFTQADSSISRRFGGSGLGLAISRRLAERMGGELKGESAPGKGSRFTVTLPFRPAAPAEPRPERQPPASPEGRALNVLVVEDNPTSRTVAEKIVTRLGHRTTSVGDGAAAVEAVRDGAFDLVLMDVRMPRMDGLTATRAIRELPGPQGRIAIIGVTADAFPQDVANCRAAGMDRHVCKPVTLASLATAIAEALTEPTVPVA